MAFNLYEHVWNCGAVEGLEKLVLLRLTDHANLDGASIRPSVARVAAHCGVSVRTARQQISSLQTKGILILVCEEDAARMMPREYKIDVEKLVALHDPLLGKNSVRLNARGKKTPIPQASEKMTFLENTPGTVCLGSEDNPRQDMPGAPGTVCLGPPAGYAGAPGTVCRENLPVQSAKIISQDNQPGKGSLRSPSARKGKTAPADLEPSGQTSPSPSPKIEAVGSSEEALQKDETEASAKPIKTKPAAKAKRIGKIGRPIQDEEKPNERQVADAHERGFAREQAWSEWQRFRDHHLAKGTIFKDWDAAWRTWLGNAVRFSARQGGGSGGRRVGNMTLTVERSLAHIATMTDDDDLH